jgi:hypothetical protein
MIKIDDNLFFIIKIFFNLYNFSYLIHYSIKTVKLFKKSELNRCLITWMINSSFIFIENDTIISNYCSKYFFLYKTLLTILIQFGKSQFFNKNKKEFKYKKNIIKRFKRENCRIFKHKTKAFKIYKFEKFCQFN